MKQVLIKKNELDNLSVKMCIRLYPQKRKPITLPPTAVTKITVPFSLKLANPRDAHQTIMYWRPSVRLAHEGVVLVGAYANPIMSELDIYLFNTASVVREYNFQDEILTGIPVEAVKLQEVKIDPNSSITLV